MFIIHITILCAIIEKDTLFEFVLEKIKEGENEKNYKEKNFC